jgi:hypothetical protein
MSDINDSSAAKHKNFDFKAKAPYGETDNEYQPKLEKVEAALKQWITFRNAWLVKSTQRQLREKEAPR